MLQSSREIDFAWVEPKSKVSETSSLSINRVNDDFNIETEGSEMFVLSSTVAELIA
jgi:hypothetical protein